VFASRSYILQTNVRDRGGSMMETIMVPVNREMKRVPVLTKTHLRIIRMLDNGADISTLVADRQMRRAVNDLCRLGWVSSRGNRH